MTKRDMKKALGASLKAEEQAVKSRFEKVETVPEENEPLQPEQPKPPKPQESVEVMKDSLTLAGEDELISRIKTRCMRAGKSVNKSDVLRAGVAALEAMQDKELLRSFEELLPVKTVRLKRIVRIVAGGGANAHEFRKRTQSKRLQFSRRVKMGQMFATITWTKHLC